MKTFFFFLCSIFVFFPQNEIEELSFSGVLSEKKAEISGLAWYKNNLVILPQYPQRDVLGKDALYYLSKKDILKAIKAHEILQPKPIPINFSGVLKTIDGYEGFESIVFNGRDVYLTIESNTNGVMGGWLVKGLVSNNFSEIVINAKSLTKIPMHQQIKNMSYESILIYDDKVYVFYEANGKNVNPKPKVHIFDLNLNYLNSTNISLTDYRITDVTQPRKNSFWAINYMWPGENELLKPVIKSEKSIETLVCFTIEQNTIHPIKTLTLGESKDSRNWEGLVELEGEGFILATDKYPKSIIGFLKY